jgi:hypothetical protein
MPPIKPVVMLKIIANMMMAGIDANAHLTINTTMEKKGICKSTTITFLASSESLMIYLQAEKEQEYQELRSPANLAYRR